MIKAVVTSDSHGNDEALRKIIADNPDADYFLHCGDFDSDIAQFPQLTAVCGNHDICCDILPLERILTISGHRILMLHGHQHITSMNSYRQVIAEKGRESGCDIVLFGHVHIPVNEDIDGIRIINPGSLLFNFNLVRIGYTVITFRDDGSFDAERVILPRRYQIT